MSDEGERLEHQYRERKRSLTDKDIQEILEAFDSRMSMHSCRFPKVTTEDFYESVQFYKHINDGITNSRNLVGKTILIILVTFILGAIGSGIVSKIVSVVQGIKTS